MNRALPLPLETPMPLPRFQSREWIWLPRILLALVFLANGGMRLTLPPQELALLGDWTLGLLPPAATGLVQILASLTLLLPRRQPWGSMTMAGAFLLVTYLLGSLLTHLTAATSHGWAIDVLRLFGLSIVFQDLWRSHFLNPLRS